MTELWQILIFIAIGIGWVAFFYLIAKYIRRLIDREIQQEKAGKVGYAILIFDFVFLFFSAYYGFYGKLVKDIIPEVIPKNPSATTILPWIFLLLIYIFLLGILSFFAPPFEKGFRYGVSALCIYAFFGFGLIIAITGLNRLTELKNLATQIFGMYEWFLAFLFPFEVGVIGRRIKQFYNRKKVMTGNFRNGSGFPPAPLR